MSEKQNFEAMLINANVSYLIYQKGMDKNFHLYTENPDAKYAIEVDNKGLGYVGFVSLWVFDTEGKLLYTGSYE